MEKDSRIQDSYAYAQGSQDLWNKPGRSEYPLGLRHLKYFLLAYSIETFHAAQLFEIEKPGTPGDGVFVDLGFSKGLKIKNLNRNCARAWDR